MCDPAFAPGTGTPEPGGLTSGDLLRAVRRIAAEVGIVGLDVVEVSPPYDNQGAITALLGNRASGGCVRLPPEKAAQLFNRFRREEQGMVPVFAYDAPHRRTSGDGEVQRDANGDPVLQQGYRVLLFIEDYPGGPAFVAVVT